MSKRSDIRRLAMQAMYQVDVRRDADFADVVDTVRDAPKGDKLADLAIELAQAAWAVHDAADAAVAQYAPEWPTHRQPPVDRAILRLAYYEMLSGHAPVKVAINEAIELGKAFGTAESPKFINAVLDKLAKELRDSIPDQPQTPEPDAPSADEWLADAVKDSHPESDADTK